MHSRTDCFGVGGLRKRATVIATSRLDEADLALLELNTENKIVLRLIEEVRRLRHEVACQQVQIADLECEARR